MDFEAKTIDGYDDSVIGVLNVKLNDQERATVKGSSDPTVTLARLVFREVAGGSAIPENPCGYLYVDPHTFGHFQVEPDLSDVMDIHNAERAVGEAIKDGQKYKKLCEKLVGIATKYQEGDAE
ncbi:hypothetical protein FBF27_02420 [Candidatus Saccharibacteria bacterium oral taxon 488]|nr:hypothetical protein FBF27_02420 [Candidatus Saccharibacteria bacterium oral taxon 488]